MPLVGPGLTYQSGMVNEQDSEFPWCVYVLSLYALLSDVGFGVSNSGPLCTLLTDRSLWPCFDVPLQHPGVLKECLIEILGFCCCFTLFN